MTSNATSLRELIGPLIREGKRRLVLMSAAFSVVALAALAMGILAAKKYDASVLIVVEGSTIKPLMDGKPPPTGDSEEAAIMLEVTQGKKILREILKFGGWVKPPPAKQPDAREEDRLLAGLRARIKIDSPKENMIRIAFRDSDPERTYKVANELARIYIAQSSGEHERESREAFEFIDKQVKDYGEKLTQLHEQVLAQYKGADPPVVDIDPGPSPTPNRPAPKKNPGRLSPDELAGLRAEAAALEIQLNHKVAPPPVESRQTEDQLRSRTLQIQAELDKLLATYTDAHPDVVRVRRELDTAKQELQRVVDARIAREADVQTAAALDDDLARAARARLEEIQKKIADATGERQERQDPTDRTSPQQAKNPALDTKTQDPGMKNIGQDTTLSELLRKYEATRDIYQDFLKRRESARVAMELDAEHRGFEMRIEEPAEMPVAASGLRLIHFCIIGLVLASLLPLGLLFLYVRFDPRVRSSVAIERFAKVPLLVSISFAPAKTEKKSVRNHALIAALMVAGVFVVYIATFSIKTKSS